MVRFWVKVHHHKGAPLYIGTKFANSWKKFFTGSIPGGTQSFNSQASPRKFYLADNGLFTILAENINLGAKVENMILLKLARSGNVRYYRRNGDEVDFIIGRQAIESKYKEAITAKDIAPLKKVRNVRDRIVITQDREGEMNGIQLVPLWKFLLQDDLQDA